MGFLGEYEGTERIDIEAPSGDKYYVDVKRCLSVAESEGAERSLVNVEMEDQDDGKTKARVRPDMVANIFELVAASVVDWDLTDASDKLLGLHPAEVLRDSLHRLPRPVFDKIAARVRELNTDRTKEEEARFPAGTERGPEGGEVDQPDDHQVLSGSGDLATVGAASGSAAAD
jgi:hypothetical protein